MTFEIKDLDEIEGLLKMIPEAVEVISTAVKKLEVQQTMTKQWYELQDCYELRGGGSLSTLRNQRYYQPKGGIPDGKIQGRKVWSKATVIEWLQQTDETLPEYHKKYGTGATK